VQLQERVAAALRRLASLALKQADLIRRRERSDFDAIDRLIEITLRDKERSIGALKQHRIEHGC